MKSYYTNINTLCYYQHKNHRDNFLGKGYRKESPPAKTAECFRYQASANVSAKRKLHSINIIPPFNPVEEDIGKSGLM